MNVSLKKAFSIIAFTSLMLTVSIYVGYSMFHHYKFDHCVSLKAASGDEFQLQHYPEKHKLECLEMVN
jgi:hypothetical protein